jgi:uncharacterized protein YbbK (DUF523 family)
MKCRFNGTDKLNQEILDMVARGEAVPVCPEQLGGLPTPREACEQIDDRVVSPTGKDYTEAFEKGADETLKLAKAVSATEFIGRIKSPSCGTGKVFDGTFTETLTDGDGVTAGLLKKNGIKVTSI